jgi:hypothetical protein
LLFLYQFVFLLVFRRFYITNISYIHFIHGLRREETASQVGDGLERTD